MRFLVNAAVFLGLTAIPAAASTFSSETLFLDAANPVVTEDFEDAPLSGSPSSGALSSIDFGGFEVSSSPNALKVLDSNNFGAGNTTPGGSNYLLVDTDVGFVTGITTFTFDSLLSAFGFWYSDAEGSGTISFGGQTFALSATGNGGSSFFGYVGNTFVDSFTIDFGDDSNFGIDDVSYAPVPLPAGLPLLLAGLGALAIARRRAQ